MEKGPKVIYSSSDSVLTHFLPYLIFHRKGIHHNKQKHSYNLWLTLDGDNDMFSSKICVRQSYK